MTYLKFLDFIGLDSWKALSWLWLTDHGNVAVTSTSSFFDFQEWFLMTFWITFNSENVLAEKKSHASHVEFFVFWNFFQIWFNFLYMIDSVILQVASFCYRIQPEFARLFLISNAEIFANSVTLAGSFSSDSESVCLLRLLAFVCIVWFCILSSTGAVLDIVELIAGWPLDLPSIGS